MCFTVRKINIMLSLLLVVVCSWGQVTDAKNFTITPQTVVKTNLPKQAPCLFELQDILRERFAKRHYGRVTGKRQFGYRALDRL